MLEAAMRVGHAYGPCRRRHVHLIDKDTEQVNSFGMCAASCAWMCTGLMHEAVVSAVVCALTLPQNAERSGLRDLADGTEILDRHHVLYFYVSLAV